MLVMRPPTTFLTTVLNALVLFTPATGCSEAPTTAPGGWPSLPPRTHVVLTVADSAGVPLTPVYARWRYPVGSFEYQYHDAPCLDVACTRFAVTGPTFGVIEVEVSTRRLAGPCVYGQIARHRLDVRSHEVREVHVQLSNRLQRCGVVE